MGKDTLNAVSSFGEGLAPALNRAHERQFAKREEERRAQRDQQFQRDLVDLRTDIDRAEADRKFTRDVMMLFQTGEQAKDLARVRGSESRESIRQQAVLDERVKTALMNHEHTHDFARMAEAARWDTERIANQLEANIEFTRFAEGLKDKHSRAAALKGFLYSSLLEGSRQRFTSQESKLAFEREMEKLEKSSSLNREAQRSALTLQHMFENAPIMAYQILAAKGSDIPVITNADGSVTIDWGATTPEQLDKFAKTMDTAMQSGAADRVTNFLRSKDLGTQEGLDSIQKFRGVLGQAFSRSGDALLKGLKALGIDTESPTGQTPGKAVGDYTSYIRGRNEDNVRMRQAAVGASIQSGSLRDGWATRIDLGELTGLAKDKLFEMSGRSPVRKGGLLVPTDETLSKLQRVDRETPRSRGVVTLDLISGDVVQMFTSAEHLPETWRGKPDVRSEIVGILDEISGEDIDEVTDLFSGDVTALRRAGGLMPAKLQMLNETDYWAFGKRFKKNLKDLNITKVTPRSPDNIRLAILAYVDGYRPGILDAWRRENKRKLANYGTTQGAGVPFGFGSQGGR